jgi:hypothetical protein
LELTPSTPLSCALNKQEDETVGGTTLGGLKASKTNKSLYGEDWYARIGKIGGSKGKTGGFASEKIGKDGLTGRERASKAGKAGGTISRRTKKQ